MELTGLQIRNMQMLEDLEKTIKELEMKRIENDLLNRYKYTDLYEVYYKLLGGRYERGYKDQFFYRVGDILKSKEGKVFYKTRDKISSDL